MAIEDGKDITEAPRRNTRSSRDVRSDWVESAYRTLSRATRGEAVRASRRQIPEAAKVSLVLAELAELWRTMPPRGERTIARRLNKNGPVGFPPEASGLEAIVGTVAAVLWAAHLTRENEMVPELLSRAVQRSIVIDKTEVPATLAAEFLALLQQSLDRKVLALARAQALHEVAHLPQRVEFGPLPDLPKGRRLWMVTLAKLLKARPSGVGHWAICEEAKRSLDWSKKMSGVLRDLGYLPKKPPRASESFGFSAKGKAWIRQHAPDLA
ncbi:MAG: hypothetical protein K8J09_00480 [Planctomycetes bacterium]|nr:hypothetical protein [Planctomycetota bacterium]MCC7395630.1 hypothetical protein [Planctomycetota bacterium]